MIDKNIQWYRNCANATELLTALQAYAMIGSNSSVSTAMDWAKYILHQDGKNRSVMSGGFDVNSNPIDSSVEVDAYYQLALVTAMNSFLAETQTDTYHQTYCQTLAILLINVGARDILDKLQLDPDIATKTENALNEITDMIYALIKKAKVACAKLQPELASKFNDLGVNLINEPTTTVISRWFIDQDGNTIINDELKLELQGLRADYLRLVSKKGHVELAVLLKLFNMSSTTYHRYRKIVISKIVPKCDASVLQYVKYLMLNK